MLVIIKLLQKHPPNDNSFKYEGVCMIIGHVLSFPAITCVNVCRFLSLTVFFSVISSMPLHSYYKSGGQIIANSKFQLPTMISS